MTRRWTFLLVLAIAASPVPPPPSASADVADATRLAVALLSTRQDNGSALYEAQQRGMVPVEAVFRFGSPSQRLAVLHAAAAALRVAVPLDSLTEGSLATRAWGRAEQASPWVARARQRLVRLPVSFDGLAIPPGPAGACRSFPTRTSSDTVLVQSEVELQFTYLLSTVLREGTRSADAVSPEPRRLLREIATALHDKVRCYWEVLPAWHWSGPFVGIRARMAARLDDSVRVRSPWWYGAVLDHDLYLLFIAADVLAAHHAQPSVTRVPDDAVARLVEIRSVTRRMLAARIRPIAGDTTFLFDYGRWSANPSYAYAGCTIARPLPTAPCPVDSVATDVSHALRWPWWLRSVAASWPPLHPERGHTDSLASRYAHQVARHVLYFTDEGLPRFRNYMDGRDGWYRLREFPSHPWGHGPSTLTGAMRYGSWALVAPLSPQLQRAQRKFCDALSDDGASVRTFRTRWYGSGSDVPDSGGVGVTDLYGQASPFALICRLTGRLGYLGVSESDAGTASARVTPRVRR
jgi:hypothetical protein